MTREDRRAAMDQVAEARALLIGRRELRGLVQMDEQSVALPLAARDAILRALEVKTGEVVEMCALEAELAEEREERVQLTLDFTSFRAGWQATAASWRGAFCVMAVSWAVATAWAAWALRVGAK